MNQDNKLTDVYIGRQPIFDREMNVYAYELLFRNGEQFNVAHIVDEETATAQVLINAFVEIGIYNLVGHHKAFVNFTQQFLLEDNAKFLPQSQVVIEVLETVKPTQGVINALKTLRDRGYTIALDDFFYTDEYKSLVALAHIIKIDILATGIRQLPAHVQAIRAVNAEVKLLAEKVESKAQFDLCKALGMHYFQGYFFAKPQIIKGQALPSNKLAVVNLLGSVYDPDVDMVSLSDIIGRDVGLSHKLLTFVQSYPGNEHIEINSIKDAVMRFGLQKLQSWVSVLVLSGKDDKTPELFKVALIRARFIQSLAETTKVGNSESFFLAGLFSCLEALMDADIASLLEKMPLNQDIKDALTNCSGVMGAALSCALAIEQANPKAIRYEGMDVNHISQAYLQAMVWANSTLAALDS